MVDSDHDIAAAMLANALIANTGSRKQATARAAKAITKQSDAAGKALWQKVHNLLRSGKSIPAHYRGHFDAIPSRHAVHYVRIEVANGGGVDSDEQISKESAGYRAGTDQRHCEICTMFRHNEHDTKIGDGRCTLVKGPISPTALCDYFERQKGRAVGGGVLYDNGLHYERVKGIAQPKSFQSVEQPDGNHGRVK